MDSFGARIYSKNCIPRWCNEAKDMNKYRKDTKKGLCCPKQTLIRSEFGCNKPKKKFQKKMNILLEKQNLHSKKI